METRLKTPTDVQSSECLPQNAAMKIDHRAFFHEKTNTYVNMIRISILLFCILIACIFIDIYYILLYI